MVVQLVKDLLEVRKYDFDRHIVVSDIENRTVTHKPICVDGLRCRYVDETVETVRQLSKRGHLVVRDVFSWRSLRAESKVRHHPVQRVGDTEIVGKFAFYSMDGKHSLFMPEPDTARYVAYYPLKL